MEFDNYFIQNFRMQSIYRQAVQKFILSKEKPCYFIVRKARQNPTVIADTAIAVLTKCIAYKDLSEDRCTVFLK